MDHIQKNNILNEIFCNEKLRSMNRISRLLRKPFRTLPYYILAAASHLKPYKITFATLWGDKMIGYLPEANTFYYYGYCEANLAAFLLRYLKEGSTFIDVGAHIGFYSMLASNLTGNIGKVCAFEPTPWTYELLKENIKDKHNVYTFNIAASDQDGETSFSDYGPGYGAYNSASKEGTILNFEPKKIVAKTIRLDEFFKQRSITPDFIKLDAEGLEYKIIAGLKETLKTSRPLITLEMAGDDKWSENRKISSDLLLKANYESYNMSDSGFIERCDIKSSYTYTNILFLPREKLNLVKDLLQ